MNFTRRSEARSSEAGLNLEGERLAAFDDRTPLKVALPSVNQVRVRLELRCAEWVPQKFVPNSQDPPTPGVQVFNINVRSDEAGEKCFKANTGQWTLPSAAEKK